MLLLAALSAYGQNTEIGATAGGGTVAVEDIRASGRFAAGAEICVLCTHRFAVFGDYTRIWKADNRPSDVTTFDLISGGLRIQGGRRVRPFLDAGVVYGVDRFRYPVLRGGLSFERGFHGNPGLVLAGGASLPLGSRFYVRPQVRMYVLKGLHVAIWAGIGIGLRL